MTPELLIIKPGLLTTVQDLGRWGLQSRGVSVAGPMDPRAHRIANALAGNPPEAATLEATLIGPEVRFMDERVVAVAGGEFELWLDDRQVSEGRSISVAAGSRLRFGRRVRGSRAYLAIAGGIAVPPELGSRATHLVSRMGGLEGRALIAGDRLPLGERIRLNPDPTSAGSLLKSDPIADRTSVAESPLKRDRGSIAEPTSVSVGSGVSRIAESPIAIPDGHARVRVLPGPQDDRFEAEAFEALQAVKYRIAAESDRMGFRLEGPTLKRKPGGEIISDATPLGVLQVPASGQPVLLMADRQTTGGYPAIATVITADIGVVGQLGPGDTIRFEICTRREAMAALIAQERTLMAIESAVGS